MPLKYREPGRFSEEVEDGFKPHNQWKPPLDDAARQANQAAQDYKLDNPPPKRKKDPEAYTKSRLREARRTNSALHDWARWAYREPDGTRERAVVERLRASEQSWRADLRGEFANRQPAVYPELPEWTTTSAPHLQHPVCLVSVPGHWDAHQLASAIRSRSIQPLDAERASCYGGWALWRAPHRLFWVAVPPDAAKQASILAWFDTLYAEAWPTRIGLDREGTRKMTETNKYAELNIVVQGSGDRRLLFRGPEAIVELVRQFGPDGFGWYARILPSRGVIASDVEGDKGVRKKFSECYGLAMDAICNGEV